MIHLPFVPTSVPVWHLQPHPLTCSTLAHSHKKKIIDSETFQGYSLSKLCHDACLGVPKKLKEQPLHTMCNGKKACLARGYDKNCATATL